jgi:hypothetical protein
LPAEEILLMQAMVEAASKKPSKAVMDSATKILKELNDKELGVSPRRMLTWIRAAAAKAMLERGAGAALESKDLIIGEHILWITPESRQKIGEIVNGISDPDRLDFLRAKADFETLRNKARSIKTLQEQSELLINANRLLDLVAKHDSGLFQELLQPVKDLKEKVMATRVEKITP